MSSPRLTAGGIDDAGAQHQLEAQESLVKLGFWKNCLLSFEKNQKFWSSFFKSWQDSKGQSPLVVFRRKRIFYGQKAQEQLDKPPQGVYRTAESRPTVFPLILAKQSSELFGQVMAVR